MQAIGYKEFKPYFLDNVPLEVCIEEVKRNTKHFAKRQYTWFKNQMPVDWYENKIDAIEDIKQWIST